MAKSRKPTQDDILRLGAEVAAVKAKANPKAWRALVKRAHARGFTVAGELSGQPDALKERLQSSLRTQAQKTIASAYKPAEIQLKGDEAKIAAYDAKRKADNASYEQWLAQQREKQDATLAGTASLITQQNQQIADETKQVWAQAAAQAQSNVASQPGVVSDMSKSNALNFSAEAARGNQMVDNARQTTNAVLAAGVEQQRGTNQALLAQAGAREAQRYADTQAKTKDLLDQKSKLAISKASDVLKEFTRLQGLEVDKANANRDFNALTEKLGIAHEQNRIDALKLNHTISKDATSAAQRAQQIAIDKAKVLLNKGKADLNSDGKVDAKDYKLKKQIEAQATADAKPAGGKKGPTAGQITQSTQKVSAVSRVYALLLKLHKQYDPKYGGTPDAKHNINTFRNILTGTVGSGGASKAMIDLAEDARRHNGKISPANYAKARSIGILHPEKVRL